MPNLFNYRNQQLFICMNHLSDSSLNVSVVTFQRSYCYDRYNPRYFFFTFVHVITMFLTT